MEVVTEEVTVQHVDKECSQWNHSSQACPKRQPRQKFANLEDSITTVDFFPQLEEVNSCCRKPTNQMKNLGGNEDQGQR